MGNKRGQFFLLAAVIISVITIGFGAVTNQVVATPEPRDLSEYSFDIKREAGNVIDYEIYQNLPNNTHLPSFIDLLASEIREKDPELNFMFAYGNQDHMTIRNYASEGVYSCEDSNCVYTPGGTRKINSTIRWGSSSTQVSGEYNNNRDNWEYTQNNLGPSSNITLRIRDHDYTFDITQSRRVIFIMLKDDEDESFVYVR